MLYHVMIWPQSAAQRRLGEIYAFNLTEEQLRKRFIAPYNEGRPIVSLGRTLPPGDVSYLRVGQTDGPYDEQAIRTNYVEHKVFQATEQVTDDWITDAPGAAGAAPVASDGPVQLAVTLCRRFDTVARQLLRRHQGRSTLEINDEYDVQDLMHALLHINFFDVRAESWNPTYLGGATRVDFLVPDARFIIEVKKTRATLTDRGVGSELAEDVTRYSDPGANRGASTLICFVHDPDRLLANPAGLETDLAAASNERLTVVGVVG